MDREQVIDLAKKAETKRLAPAFLNGFWTLDHDELCRFAALVAAAVKEEDARICENYIDPMWKHHEAYINSQELAAEIRASIQTEGK